MGLSTACSLSGYRLYPCLCMYVFWETLSRAFALLSLLCQALRTLSRPEIAMASVMSGLNITIIFSHDKNSSSIVSHRTCLQNSGGLAQAGAVRKHPGMESETSRATAHNGPITALQTTPDGMFLVSTGVLLPAPRSLRERFTLCWEFVLSLGVTGREKGTLVPVP